jgi:hypothetical protein
MIHCRFEETMNFPFLFHVSFQFANGFMNDDVIEFGSLALFKLHINNNFFFDSKIFNS